jgi:hypothetical protein
VADQSGRSSFCLRILGTPFEFISSDERWVELVAELWAPFESPVVDPCKVRISRSADKLKVEVGAEWFSVTDPWWLLVWMRSEMLRQALAAVGQGFVGLHASTLIDAHGRTVTLVGRSGAGKTTLTLELLARGWSLLEEDLASFVDQRILPFHKPLTIKDVARWSELSGIWGPPKWLPPPTKMFLLPSSSFDVGRDPLPMDAALFPRFSPDEDGRVEPISSAHAAVLASEHTLGPEPPSPRTLIDMFKDVPAATLESGGAVGGANFIESFMSKR